MIVCHCKGITDRDIRALVREGKDSLDFALVCSAGLDCRGCRLSVERVVRAEREKLKEKDSLLDELAPVP